MTLGLGSDWPRSEEDGGPREDQDICLALAFNRNKHHTDPLRVRRMEMNSGQYVITVSHNREANSRDGPHHIDAKFGNQRFMKVLEEHFEKVVHQRLRVKSIVLDWFWMQSGGEGPGGWITGYLSGSQKSDGYHLLSKTIPTLFKDHGLQDVFLPVDVTGVVFTAIQQCQKELMDAKVRVEFWKTSRLRINPDDHPLYLASIQVNKECKETSQEGLGPQEHVDRYCHSVFPFVHLSRGNEKWSPERLEISWEEELYRVGGSIKPQPFSPTKITKKRRRPHYVE